MRFHLIGNSHLDPVWLWDWREGLNEGITTCRTILNLMREFPELTYVRGETSTYRHIQENDPATFSKIREMIAEGRWDVVGGTVCQPDTNLPATEVLCRQFAQGLDYMRRELGVRPLVAWAADSFGHSYGWPEIYAAAGMKYFAFSRPFEGDCSLPSPAFNWKGPGGRKVLSWRIPIGWYGSERGEVARRLDQYRAKAESWGVENIAVTYGLGNHGGGPTALQIREIMAWRDANRDVSTEFSTFHRFFEALTAEKKTLPVVSKELNFTLRGCFSSAFRYKKAYRRTETLLLSAERTTSLVSAAFARPAPDLNAAWDSVLFNTFHDILPGSSLERTYEDQHAWLGVAFHDARRHELTALNALAARCDTRVPEPAEDMPSAVPVLLWNPHPHPVSTHVEFEACLEYRPIASYAHRPDELPVEVLNQEGKPVAFQLLMVENQFGLHQPWRKRVLLPVTLPACGFQVFSIAWNEAARVVAAPASLVRAEGDHLITNGALTVSARPGDTGINLMLDGRPLGNGALKAATFDDPYGSWGNHDGERAGDDISTVLADWSVVQTKLLECGPYRASLWVMMQAGASRLELVLHVEQGTRQVRAEARLLWNERSARLKLILPGGGASVLYEVPGGDVRRGELGEVPGGRWIRADHAATPFVFASDGLYNFDLKDGTLRATVLRSTRYSRNTPAAANEEPWRPHLDLGEHRFQFAIATADTDAWALADSLEQPVTAMVTYPHDGTLGRSGSLLALPPGVRLLALKPAYAGDGWILRIQNVVTAPLDVTLTWVGAPLDLGTLTPYEIASWRITCAPSGWSLARVNTAEEPAVVTA